MLIIETDKRTDIVTPIVIMGRVSISTDLITTRYTCESFIVVISNDKLPYDESRLCTFHRKFPRQ